MIAGIDPVVSSCIAEVSKNDLNILARNLDGSVCPWQLMPMVHEALEYSIQFHTWLTGFLLKQTKLTEPKVVANLCAWLSEHQLMVIKANTRAILSRGALCCRVASYRMHAVCIGCVV